MHVYLEALSSIILIYASILNLCNYEFKLREIAGVIAVSELAAAIMVNLQGEFGAMMAIILIAMIFLYFRTRRIISISLPFISVIICIFMDFLMSNAAVYLMQIDMKALKVDKVLYWEGYILYFLLVYISSKTIGVLINKKSKVTIFEIKGAFGVLLILSLFLTLVIFYFNIYFNSSSGYTKEIIKTNGIMFFIYTLLLMAIIYVIIRGIKKDTEARNKQVQLDQLQDYSRNLEKMYTEMRAFRHDYVNILSSMSGYMTNKDYEGLEQYFDHNIIPMGKGIQSNNFKLDLLKNIKITELKGLLSSKLISAQELGIDIEVDIIEPIEKIDMNIVDLIRVMGILVDNAVEAAAAAAEPATAAATELWTSAADEVEVEIAAAASIPTSKASVIGIVESKLPYLKLAVVKKENSVLIVVVNSCSAVTPPIYKMFEKGFSTKGNDRGYGLYNVRQILGGVKNASLDTSMGQGEFIQCLEVRNI